MINTSKSLKHELQRKDFKFKILIRDKIFNSQIENNILVMGTLRKDEKDKRY